MGKKDNAMNIVEQFEQKQIEKLSEGKAIPEFKAGDTVRVNVKIVEGTTERVQAFEGVCISRKNRGIHSSFTVRKVSHGEGVERIFPLYSPRIDSIEVVRKGIVRRAKLYYLRELSGKAARIAEKREFATAADAKAAANSNKAAAKQAAEDAKKEAPKADAKAEKPAEEKATKE